MINKKLIHFNTYSAFEANKSQLYDWTIAFIGETKQIYTHGNFYDCNIANIVALQEELERIESAIPTKVSQLENDVPYVVDDVMPENGVYAVTAEGKFIAYNDANIDATCLGVALITDNQKIMIEKMGEANAEWNSNTTLYWGKNLYGKNVAGITETTDQTVAKADFNGKDHTAAIIAAYTEHSVAMDARDMCSVLQTFNDGENNGGFTDWYIPAEGQLYEIYTNKTNINAALTAMSSTAFSGSYYWSSSEYSSSGGWIVNFSNGGVDDNYKYGNNRVRFVRDIQGFIPFIIEFID